MEVFLRSRLWLCEMQLPMSRKSRFPTVTPPCKPLSFSLIDWSRSRMENNGRNGEVQVALQSLPPGVTENEWFYSPDELDLHSALLRTGQSEVFAESGEMEAFSLMLQVPLAIYLPGYTELYPQSVPLGSDNEDYLVGICHGNHYFLAVPRRWIQNQQGKHKGMLRMLSK